MAHSNTTPPSYMGFADRSPLAEMYIKNIYGDTMGNISRERRPPWVEPAPLAWSVRHPHWTAILVFCFLAASVAIFWIAGALR